jgi:hypothetical protein
VTLVSWLNVVNPLALLLTVVLVVALRLLTYWLGWQTPTATDLTPLVASAPGRAVRTSGRALGWVRRAAHLRRRSRGTVPRDDTHVRTLPNAILTASTLRNLGGDIWTSFD